MRDLIITTVVTLIAFVITRILPIKDEIALALINLVPVFIPTFYLWYIMPRNYMKLIGFKNINIKYQIYIRIDKCYLTDIFFAEVNNNLLELDNQNKGRILNKDIGELIMKSTLEINSGVVDLQYYIHEKSLILKSSSKVKYKLFYKTAKEFLGQVDLLFKSNEGISYKEDNLKVNLRIEFIDNKNNSSKNETKNPFWNILFLDFKNKVVDLKYITNNNNKVIISNDIIEFVGNNLESISNDIKKELTIITFFN